MYVLGYRFQIDDLHGGPRTFCESLGLSAFTRQPLTQIKALDYLRGCYDLVVSQIF